MDKYSDQFNELCHLVMRNHFFKQEIIEVPDLLTCLVITHDGVLDDTRESRTVTLDELLARMSLIKPDWPSVRDNLARLKDYKEKTIYGRENRTIYVIRGGQIPEQWTKSTAIADAMTLFGRAAYATAAEIIYAQVTQLRQYIPVGHEHFSQYEHFVRIAFNYLFSSELGDGQAQSRTEPENEGLEKRDIVFHNKAESGFWYDLKVKYSASEIVVDAKNTDDLGRDDLRQLYCYLKPALGLWGFIVCRSEPTRLISAFNRTLFQNFEQKRRLLILCDDDLRRMVEQARRGNRPSEYLQDRMSKFVRSV